MSILKKTLRRWGLVSTILDISILTDLHISTIICCCCCCYYCWNLVVILNYVTPWRHWQPRDIFPPASNPPEQYALIINRCHLLFQKIYKPPWSRPPFYISDCSLDILTGRFWGGGRGMPQHYRSLSCTPCGPQMKFTTRAFFRAVSWIHYSRQLRAQARLLAPVLYTLLRHWLLSPKWPTRCTVISVYL